MARIQLFFDFISPYAYLAFCDLQRRAEERGDVVVFEPVLFAGLLDHHGQRGPAEIPAKRRWLVRDALRRAQRLAVDFTFPATHPFRPLTALRLSLPEVARGDQARVVETLFEHGWRRGGELGDDARLAEALTAAGLDGTLLVERTQAPPIKALLRERTEAAIELGVFGVPTMITEGELFWGSDRVDDMFDHIDGRLHVDSSQSDALLERRASATRT